VAKRRKRRVWTSDEKRMVCAQTRVPGVSVSQVARRYDVNANLVFTGRLHLKEIVRFFTDGCGTAAGRMLWEPAD
jgi:transposase-like protein